MEPYEIDCPVVTAKVAEVMGVRRVEAYRQLMEQDRGLDEREGRLLDARAPYETS